MQAVLAYARVLWLTMHIENRAAVREAMMGHAWIGALLRTLRWKDLGRKLWHVYSEVTITCLGLMMEVGLEVDLECR